ncbi:MAG: MCE family protein [Acidimicrobiales bacterium]
MSRPLRAAVAVAVLAAAVAGAVMLVRVANGDYSGDYAVTGYFPSAGEGLQPGSEVVFRGVQVGRVSTISLAGLRARVTMLLQPGFGLPADASATIEPVNLFGAEQVTLQTPHGSDRPPYLAHGATLAVARTSAQLGDLFAAAAPLLNRINTLDLSAVIGDLAQATDGEGRRIARSIGTGAQLAGFLDRTLQAQLHALDAFSRFSAAVAPDGPALNGLSDQSNVALPAFNADAAAYQQMLTNLTGFSNELATFLGDYRPDIETILAAGDNPARVLTAQQQELGQVIDGAYQYARILGTGASPPLPDGSRFAYFNIFILFSDVNSLVCNLLAPPQPGLAFLEPLQQALAGAGTPFSCQSQLAAFAAAQGSTPAPATTGAPTPAAAVPGGLGAAAQGAANQIYGILGAPSTSKPSSLGGYVQSLLGGGGL